MCEIDSTNIKQLWIFSQTSDWNGIGKLQCVWGVWHGISTSKSRGGFQFFPTFLWSLFWRCSINWIWFSHMYALQCWNHYRVLFCFNLISQFCWVFLTVLLDVSLRTGSHHSLWLPTCKPWRRAKAKQTTCWYHLYYYLFKKEICTLRSTFFPQNAKIQSRSLVL